MNFNDIPDNLKSKTDSELADILPALTRQKIVKVDAKSWLASEGLALRDPFDPNQQYYGSLIDLARQGTIPDGLTQEQWDTLRAMMKQFFGYLLETDISSLTTSSVSSGSEPYATYYFKF